MELRYGSKVIDIGFDRAFFDIVIEPPFSKRIEDPLKEFNYILENPLNTRPLKELLKEKDPGSVAVIVEDKTRKNPEYPKFLNEIIDIINKTSKSRIYLIAAYGTHSKHTREEHELLYGRENLKKVTLIDHDSRDSDSLTQIGTLSCGEPLMVNKYAAMSDFVITFGTVSPHAFAGFTGGRKAILPGIASYSVIRNNHSMVCLDNTDLGVLHNNPIHNQMTEAARLLNIDFSIQMVRDNKGDISGIFAGEPDTAFKAGVEYCKKINSVKVPGMGDIVFVSCGGHPKDKSLYQSQRAITTAAKITRPGGLMVVFAEFLEGVGDKLYYQWLKKPLEELMTLDSSQIDLGIHSAYLTARNLNKCTIALFTGMEKELTEELHFIKLKDTAKVKELVEGFHKVEKPVCYVIPNGSEILIEVDFPQGS
ncbi:MAG: nickel-dependent lactate racemase [Bacillota bacterium]